MKRRISKQTWEQLKIARAAGASYTELADQSGIPRGTIHAHAHRKGWSREIALARPKAHAHQSPDISEAVQRVLHDRGLQTKMHLSEFLVKAAKQLAGRAEDFPVDSMEGAKILEQIRSSLFPQPVMIDHRSLGVHVEITKGLSKEALDKIEQMAKIM